MLSITDAISKLKSYLYVNMDTNENKRKKVVNCGLSGGGYYGYSEIAVLKELEKYKEYVDIKNISGTSVGSIVATLYAINYTPDELMKIMFDLDFDKLIRDTSLPYIKLYSKYGMYEANKLEEEIERLIRVKTNVKLCTFSQVEKNLTIVSTNLNYQCPVLFNKNNNPDMPISKAVRFSVTYPLVMVPKEYNGCLMGDGGLFINYPIIMFENLEETIGITFAAHNENDDGTLKNFISITDVFDYFRSLGLTMSRAAYVSQIKEEHLKRSFIVNIKENISSMQFNLTKEQKQYIYQCGINAVREQVERVLGVKPIPDSPDEQKNPEENKLEPQQTAQESATQSMHIPINTEEVITIVKDIIESHPEMIDKVNNLGIIK